MDVPDVLTLVIQALTSIDICITLCAIIHIENVYLDHVAYKLGKAWFPSYPNTLTLINFTGTTFKGNPFKISPRALKTRKVSTMIKNGQ